MQQGLKSMSNALGNLAKMVRHERQVENRFNECMNIMMGYNLVRVPIGYSNQQHVPSKTNTSVSYGTSKVSDECNANNLPLGRSHGWNAWSVQRNEHCIAPNPHSK